MDKRKITLVLDDLSLGDFEAFEEATGLNLVDELQPRMVIDPRTKMPVKDPESDKGRPLMQVKISTATHLGLIYLGLRREDPSVTMDDVRKLRPADLDFDLRIGEPSPLEKADDGTSDGTS